MPQPLDYIPQTYRRTTPIWVPMTGGQVVLGTGMALIRFFSGTWNPGLLVFGTAAGLFWTTACLFVWWRGGLRECRIEGGALSFRCFGERELTTIQIADLEQIVVVESSESNRCEIIANGRRMRVLDLQVFEPRQELEHALLKQNPHIRFTRRSAARCFACDADLSRAFPGVGCPKCGQQLPRYGKWV
jgi:hypothetical protein